MPSRLKYVRFYPPSLAEIGENEKLRLLADELTALRRPFLTRMAQRYKYAGNVSIAYVPGAPIETATPIYPKDFEKEIAEIRVQMEAAQVGHVQKRLPELFSTPPPSVIPITGHAWSTWIPRKGRRQKSRKANKVLSLNSNDSSIESIT